MRKRVIESLKARGLDVITREAYKNGEKLEGIALDSKEHKSCSPIVYLDDIEEMIVNVGYAECIDHLEDIFKNHNKPNFNLGILEDEEMFLNSIYVGMQRASEQEDLVKIPCEEMDGTTELYLFIRGDADDNGYYSCKVTVGLMEQIGVSIESAVARAIENTCEESTLCSMSKLLFGVEIEDDSLYVLTNKHNVNGASAIVNRPLLEEFAREKGVGKLVILPSSVHELILVPYTEDMDIDELRGIVSAVNRDAVEPRERLCDEVFILEL